MSDFAADIEAVEAISAVPTILDVVCRTTGMGFAAVARVTVDRWIACAVRDDIQFGLTPGGELKVETTLCDEIRQHKTAVVIDNVAEDAVYCGHHTPAMYGFQSYISMPIVLPDGRFFGTLCAIDPRPARLNNPATVGMFKLFAELIAFHLSDRERLVLAEATLLDERKTAELREQFIAVLGHDLRNPLGAIGSASELLLLRTPLDERATGLVKLIQKSVWRMAGLIDNVMDFARGRLGGGLTLDRNADQPLAETLHQVITELRTSWPARPIELDVALPGPVWCDRPRIAQLLSNLVANALTYGAPDAPVRVRAVADGGILELSVANAGDPIPADELARLFLPYERGTGRASQQGLGLGLYIASEIARAHGGTLEAESSTEETRFTFRMPVD